MLALADIQIGFLRRYGLHFEDVPIIWPRPRVQIQAPDPRIMRNGRSDMRLTQSTPRNHAAAFYDVTISPEKQDTRNEYDLAKLLRLSAGGGLAEG